MAFEVTLPTHKVTFTSIEARDRFSIFQGRGFINQCFVEKPLLINFGVYDGVWRLFSNIGWQKLLEVSANSQYKEPTAELLATFSCDPVQHTCHFQLGNKPHDLTYNAISRFFGAPTDTSYGPMTNVVHREYIGNDFWKEITGEPEYDASKAATSSIIHPVLKITIRLICSLVFPAGEENKAGAGPLQILQCMVKKDKQPNLGAFVVSKLYSLATLKKPTAKIRVSGWVALFAKHLRVQFPEGLTEITHGPTTLDLNLLSKSLYVIDEYAAWTWRVRGSRYLTIPSTECGILQLSEPVSATPWIIPSRLLTPPRKRKRKRGQAPRVPPPEPIIDRRSPSPIIEPISSQLPSTLHSSPVPSTGQSPPSLEARPPTSSESEEVPLHSPTPQLQSPPHTREPHSPTPQLQSPAHTRELHSPTPQSPPQPTVDPTTEPLYRNAAGQYVTEKMFRKYQARQARLDKRCDEQEELIEEQRVQYEELATSTNTRLGVLESMISEMHRHMFPTGTPAHPLDEAPSYSQPSTTTAVVSEPVPASSPSVLQHPAIILMEQMRRVPDRSVPTAPVPQPATASSSSPTCRRNQPRAARGGPIPW